MLPPYLRRLSDREKILLVLGVAVVLLFWAYWLTARTQAFSRQWDSVAMEHSFQQSTLAVGSSSKAELANLLDAIDTTKTLTPSQLVGRVDKLSRGAELSYELSSPKTTEEDLFDLHTVTLSIRQASLAKLIAFEALVNEDFPYLSLSMARFTAVPSNPTLLDASLTITAFELKNAF